MQLFYFILFCCPVLLVSLESQLKGLDENLSSFIRDVWKRKQHHKHMHEMCKKYVVKPPPLLDYTKSKFFDPLKHIVEKGLNTWSTNKTFEKMLSRLTVTEADRLAYDTFNPPFYNQSSAMDIQASEVESILSAAPIQELGDLNGVNIGAGGRSIPGTLPLDAHRSIDGQEGLPKVQQNVPNTWLSWADSLPFKNNSLDIIISLHNFEHLADPAETMNHYIDVLKPGGGIGIVIPNYDYCWDASRDNNIWGHRWSTRPWRVCELYHKYWSDRTDLINIVIFEQKMSFGFILKKKGKFVPFDSKGVPTYGTGAELVAQGKYVHRD